MKKHNDDFLVEILTGELPPKALHTLATAFLKNVQQRLVDANISFEGIQFFATPRRLAIFIKKLIAQQDDNTIEKKGPALDKAYDKEGKPTQACLGFMKSNNIDAAQLYTIKNAQGEFVACQQKIIGKKIQEFMPEIIEQSLKALPVPKWMRWGDNATEFVRPIHSVVMLYGKDVIETTLLGCSTDRKTRGHRFHHPDWITIKSADTYEKQLEKAQVMVDFIKRKSSIQGQAIQAVKQGTPCIDEALLDEVTGLVEWPVAVCGTFDQKFLAVPQEVLISAMQDHQRYFPVMENKKLLPQFVTISNIESRDPAHVVLGNERVLRARLADAEFFFQQDQKRSLESRLNDLKTIVFQAKLGTLYDKAQRLVIISRYLATVLNYDVTLSERAALLAKTDLTSGMVGEFPELQGTMGRYYALHDGENGIVANAILEQYLPRFSGDQLPESDVGTIIAIADRMDTLVGIFGSNQSPTGEKDPFGLRRAALGILRMIIEKKLPIDLKLVLEQCVSVYQNKLENREVVPAILNFMQERLRFWYQEQTISADVFAAVAALNLTTPYDIHQRVLAVQAFKQLKEAESLSAANKRVSNILQKYPEKISQDDVDETLFTLDAELQLAKALQKQMDVIQPLFKSQQYVEVLFQLAHLRAPVDQFFDQVLVMDEDKKLRENRLLLLKKLREMFLQVADIALLQ